MDGTSNFFMLCPFLNSFIQVFDSFLECALVLPEKNIEHIISPSLWWEASPHKLLCAVRVSSAIAMAQDSDMPLAALNECIDVCISGDTM